MRYSPKRKEPLKRSRGFSLFEILIALTLTALILGLVITETGGERRALEEELNHIERVARYASDESTLKNSVTRIHFDFEKNPKEYQVEEGPSGDFTISLDTIKEGKGSKSLKEEEGDQKRKKVLNQSFKLIPGLKEGKRVIEPPVYLIGVGSSLTNSFKNDGDPSLFFYSSGERDAGIVIFGTYQELAAIKFNPITGDFDREFVTLEEASSLNEEDLQELLLKKGTELYSRWLKE